MGLWEAEAEREDATRQGLKMEGEATSHGMQAAASSHKGKNRVLLPEPPFRPVRLISHFGPPELPQIKSRLLQATEFVAIGYRSSERTSTPVKTMTLRMLVPASEMHSSCPGVVQAVSTTLLGR